MVFQHRGKFKFIGKCSHLDMEELIYCTVCILERKHIKRHYFYLFCKKSPYKMSGVSYIFSFIHSCKLLSPPAARLLKTPFSSNLLKSWDIQSKMSSFDFCVDKILRFNDPNKTSYLKLLSNSFLRYCLFCCKRRLLVLSLWRRNPKWWKLLISTFLFCCLLCCTS